MLSSASEECNTECSSSLSVPFIAIQYSIRYQSIATSDVGILEKEVCSLCSHLTVSVRST